MGKFIPKIAIFLAIFEAVGPHFLSQNAEIWHENADLGLPPPAKFYKNRLNLYQKKLCHCEGVTLCYLWGVYPLRANLYQKLPILAPVSPF